jgi:hypothetical protein
VFVLQVVFTDETCMDVCGPQAHFVRRNSDEPIRPQHTKQHRPFLRRVMFWGGIVASGPLTLVPIQGMMNADIYISVLQNNVIPFLENQPLAFQHTLQQDNAPCHKARATINFINEQSIDLLPWPPYSPDLNPIENLWGIIKMKIREEGIGSTTELTTRTLQIWGSPEIKEVCATLVESMPRRLSLCIRARGGYTKY